MHGYYHASLLQALRKSGLISFISLMGVDLRDIVSSGISHQVEHLILLKGGFTGSLGSVLKVLYPLKQECRTIGKRMLNFCDHRDLGFIHIFRHSHNPFIIIGLHRRRKRSEGFNQLPKDISKYCVGGWRCRHVMIFKDLLLLLKFPPAHPSSTCLASLGRAITHPSLLDYSHGLLCSDGKICLQEAEKVLQSFKAKAVEIGR